MAKPYMCGDELPVYVPTGGCDCNYTIRKIETLEYADAYALMLNGEQVGATINIPKDQVVNSGVVNTVVAENNPYDGAIVGDKYITLTIANSDARIYIPMKEVMGGGYIVVDELPDIGDSQHIYLVPNGGGGYDRYIYSENEWVEIGDTEVDLTNYYTKSEVNALVAGYIREDANGDVAITRNLDVGLNLDVGSNITAVESYAENHYSTYSTVSLGWYTAAAVLTSNCGSLRFSFPTGRVFPLGTTVDKLVFRFEVRASNSDGAGLYIISSSNSGSQAGYVAFDSDTALSFYNGTGASKSLAANKITVTLQGQTNIEVTLVSGADWFFSSNSTVGAHINNNACVATLTDIVAYLDIPS